MSIRGGFMGRLQREEADFKFSNLRKGSLRLIAHYVKPYRGRVLLAVLLMLLSTAASLAMPLLAKLAVDGYIVPGNLKGLTMVALAYILLNAVFWPALFGQGYLSGWVSQHVVYDIRKDMFRSILRRSIEFHRREKVGQVMSRVTNDVNNVASFVSSNLIHLFNDMLTVCGIVVVMALLDLRLTLVTMVSVPVVVVSLSIIARKMRRAYIHVQQEMAAVNTGVEQGVVGMKITQSLSRESFNIEQFEMLSLRNMKANLRTAVLFASLFPIMTVSNMLSIALVIGYGGSLVTAGTISIGVILAFLGYVNRFFGPIRELSLAYNSLQAAAASLTRIGEYLEMEPGIREPEKPEEPDGGFKGGIYVDNLTFAYKEEPVLKNIELKIDPGETIAVVGPTGAGKSTLALLLARLYDPGEGQVLIDGTDLRNISNRKLRELVTVVPQETYLFPDTVMENIRYGNPKASDEEVREAAKLIQAHDFIESLPKGYESQAGEAGALLSGGQRQLIALARAVLADPLILVLDETTAHVDALTEQKLQEAMEEVSKGRTTIIIAHRFTTIRNADRMVVIKEGRIKSVSAPHDFTEDTKVD